MSRFLRATLLAGLAALVLATHVFLDLERIRVRPLKVPIPATQGQLVFSLPGTTFPDANLLTPPFALIARISSQTLSSSPFSIAVDGTPICGRSVSPGEARRLDCAVSTGWRPVGQHVVAIRGPATPWTLTYLELANRHGGINGALSLAVLPASSDHYRRPSTDWVILAWVVLTAIGWLLPAPPLRPRALGRLYKVAAGATVLGFALSRSSEWISDYRVVLSIPTFSSGILLLFAPRLWTAVRLIEERAAPSIEAQPMMRWPVKLTAVVVVFGSVTATFWQLALKEPLSQSLEQRRVERARQRLFAAVQPVKLANCEFKRYGEANDGGYVLCANLLGSVQSGYSYGISGYDQWGCDVARERAIPMHQYDCFNLTRPACPGGGTVFHEECVGPGPATLEGRRFDSLQNHFEGNGDGAKRLVVKMDVEGAEWDSLLEVPDATLQEIDQLTIELHGIGDIERRLAVVEKLKRFFYVANLHFNNVVCRDGIAPFPSDVYEVLFVSRRLGQPGVGRGGAPPALMAPNDPHSRDCQSVDDHE